MNDPKASMVTANVLLDSVSEAGSRLTTFVLRYPRFIHSEFLTHRTFSRNSSSSRAIPVSKQIDAVEADPVLPLHWGANQKGMQAYAELQGDARSNAIGRWRLACMDALRNARWLNELGLHKQITNRVIEPYSHITVIATSTEGGLGNFYNLRDHAAAEPHIQLLAGAMLGAQNASRPRRVPTGEWHIPFVAPDEVQAIGLEIALKVSVARCARVSYLSHDGNHSIEKDLDLYERLLQEKHVSPFEHQAMALFNREAHSGNLEGWMQYRKTIDNEFRPAYGKLLAVEQTT